MFARPFGPLLVPVLSLSGLLGLAPGCYQSSGDDDDDDLIGDPCADVDGDGFCDVDADADGYPSSRDCDDRDPTVNPGVTEDGCIEQDRRDNDCDGQVDEPGQEPCAIVLTDADGDGFPSNVDCDDGDASVHPGAIDDPCCPDGKDNDCDGLVDGGGARDADCACVETIDQDHDGYDSSVDCDDLDPDTHPGVTDACPCDDEPCDDKDSDCDGQVNEDTFCGYEFADRPAPGCLPEE
jgi:putative metal-binding protein